MIPYIHHDTIHERLQPSGLDAAVYALQERRTSARLKQAG